MDELAQILQDPTPAAAQVRLERAERAMLAMPQADCPVAHHFGPGVYVRELSMKAGTWAIGHRQKFEHLNILLQGAVRMVNEDGSTTDLHAPMIFTGQPGRKVGYVLKDMVWLNVYAADERDVEALEARFVEKSEAWLELAGARLEQQRREREADRLDFAAMLNEGGLTEEIAHRQSTDTSDQVDMPASGANVRIAPSPIHGQGVFLNASVDAFTVIAPAVVNGMRTPAGRYTNHAEEPNACMVRRVDGDIDLVALYPIAGQQGGLQGEEVTINYRQAHALMNALLKNQKGLP